MVKIRLRRMGKRNRPFYRVVVADSRSPRNGKFIDIIGHYNPLTDPATISIDEEKALTWLRYGAQPSDTVRSLLGKLGIMDKVKPTSGQN
jgi:small subunit ribosomal protein S16